DRLAELLSALRARVPGDGAAGEALAAVAEVRALATGAAVPPRPDGPPRPLAPRPRAAGVAGAFFRHPALPRAPGLPPPRRPPPPRGGGRPSPRPPPARPPSTGGGPPPAPSRARAGSRSAPRPAAWAACASTARLATAPRAPPRPCWSRSRRW